MILGTQNPVVGKEEIYQISDFSGGIFTGNDIQYFWYLWRKQKNGTWLDITKKEPKSGPKVTYKFGETFLGTQFKIQVYKATKNVLTPKFDTRLFGELIVVPTSSKTPSIERVVLFNGGSRDVNKAHYSDTLTARAHCVAMFNQTVEFHLWEDDAEGPGHNPTVNKNNKHSVPFTAKVNEKGIAEASIKLSSYEKILKSIANKYLMKGDKDEGKNHEYYVTASYYGKIQGSSQVNVNVANPDYKPQSQNTPAKKTTTSSSSSKSKPKENTPNFPATTKSTVPKKADPQNKITDAYFVNSSGQKLSRVTVGDKIRVRIASNGMKDKQVQYVIWEYDAGSSDEVYRSAKIKLGYDLADMPEISITQDMFKNGIDHSFGDPDATSQNYFIEVIPLDVSADSKKFGVTGDGLMKVEKVKSAAVVNGGKQDKKDGKCICKEQYKDLIWGGKVSCEFRKKVLEISADLWGEENKKEMANNLMAVMAWETGESFSPSVKNPKSSATGLIQFMRSTAINLGTTVEALAKMTAVQQLDYVKKYFEPQRNKKLEFVDFYLQVLYPASMGKPDDHVVFSKDGTGLDKNDKNYQGRINAYPVNSGFDTNPAYGNNDGMVTKAEIKKGIQIYIDKGNQNKAKIFECVAASTQSSTTGSCSKCNKDHFDIAKPEHWVHQQPSECWKASIDILANYGLKNNSGYPQNRIIMADQSGQTLIPKDTQKALEYLDSQLKLGNPIVVGLDDNLRQATYNSHKATEHFFVIVGSGCEDGKRYYRFFDVGARTKEQGTSENSKLYLLDNQLLQGKSAGGSHTYTVTEVRRNN